MLRFKGLSAWKIYRYHPEFQTSELQFVCYLHGTLQSVAPMVAKWNYISWLQGCPCVYLYILHDLDFWQMYYRWYHFYYEAAAELLY